eukprot:482901-Rhodomonas_salina.1
MSARQVRHIGSQDHCQPRLQLRGSSHSRHQCQRPFLESPTVLSTFVSRRQFQSRYRDTVLGMAKNEPDEENLDLGEKGRRNWERLQRKTLQALDGIFSGGSSDGGPAQALTELRKWMKKTTGLGPEPAEGEVVEVEVMDEDRFRQAIQDAGLGSLNEAEITEVFEEIDNDNDGTLTMDEMCDAYLRVHAE